MRKWIIFLILAIVAISNVVIPCFALEESGFAVGPSKLNVTVPKNGSNSTYVYITSYVNGELVVGTENLTFLIEPTTIPITATDRNRKVELTVHGNTSLAAGEYSGKVTLLFYGGNNVAHGVKISATVTQAGPESQPSWLDQLLEVIAQNWVAFVAVAGIFVALTVGIYIGRKSRKNVL